MHQPEISFQNFHNLLLVLQSTKYLARAYFNGCSFRYKIPKCNRERTLSEGQLFAEDCMLLEIFSYAPSIEDTRKVWRDTYPASILFNAISRRYTNERDFRMQCNRCI